MNVAKVAAPLLCCLLLACEDKPSATSPASSASAAATTAPAPSASAPATATATATASAAPATSASAASSAAAVTDGKDAVVTVKDPTADPQKTVKVAVGGTVTVYLPDSGGAVWSADTFDKTIGKPKEEVIPGFAPGAMGHQFKWTIAGPLFKAGDSHKVGFVTKKGGKPAGGTFSLTIDIQ